MRTIPADYLQHLALRHERGAGYRSGCSDTFWLVKQGALSVLRAARLVVTAERHLPVQLPRTARIVGEGLPPGGRESVRMPLEAHLDRMPADDVIAIEHAVIPREPADDRRVKPARRTRGAPPDAPCPCRRVEHAQGEALEGVAVWRVRNVDAVYVAVSMEDREGMARRVELHPLLAGRVRDVPQLPVAHHPAAEDEVKCLGSAGCHARSLPRARAAQAA